MGPILQDFRFPTQNSLLPMVDPMPLMSSLSMVASFSDCYCLLYYNILCRRSIELSTLVIALTHRPISAEVPDYAGEHRAAALHSRQVPAALPRLRIVRDVLKEWLVRMVMRRLLRLSPPVVVQVVAAVVPTLSLLLLLLLLLAAASVVLLGA